MERQPTSTNTTKRTRKTRFVCISDTHNCTVKIPHGDVLIHCGDLTNQGSFPELQKQIEWLSRAPHEVKIVVAGNHDVTLDTNFYAKYGSYFHNPALQTPADCQALLTESKSLTYLLHCSRTIRLARPDGPHTQFNIFGSPYTPEEGRWAFQYSQHSADDGAASTAVWSAIPLDTDVLVTHGPALGHLDERIVRHAAGCEALRQSMWRVRPRLAVCGHVHEGRGVQRIRWGLTSKGTRYLEDHVEEWIDPAPESDKISLVDLTAKGGRPLDNDGSKAMMQDPQPPHIQPYREEMDTTAPPGLGTRGLGGDPDSPRSDRPALAGRLGRRETCIINCAIQATGYPHNGPRRLNKAVVVDLELPVWEGEDCSS